MSVHPAHAYVGSDGIRDLTVEQHVYRKGGVVVVNDKESPQVVQINLTPEALDFLIDHLPQRDEFTEHLRYAKLLAKDALWLRTGGTP